jgi:hypothetical protein
MLEPGDGSVEVTAVVCRHGQAEAECVLENKAFLADGFGNGHGLRA